MPGYIEFDDFYATTYRRVVGYVYAMIGNLAEAEDAVQEAYSRAWPRWSKLHDYADPEAWVRTVAYRAAVSSWRKATNRLRAHRLHGAPADVPELGPEHITLVEGLRKLNADQRYVLVLHHLVGLSVEDIAHETGVAVGTVKSRLSRGRRALAVELGELTGDGDSGTRKMVSDV
ncbi:SigE family RNA polymerase sigma factor [Micromonospora sp. NBC_01796]|uniref:SigE family RNA polymerase sigma factor n=1 Tax=Micromonospora sp. NBC_01796 TaxID=2975987 RepID=UPI002DDA3986|nr:SigE family RNA polymerase sigma factor [Micromonospora sp. NBC_01796]WSA87431.1 SigE family RNA polymerase sigma factor [Micromonospora sp. NBC_01796]